MQLIFKKAMEIYNTETLNALLGKRKLKHFTFNFSWLSDDENERWQKKISKSYYACGCETGSIFLLLSIVGVGIYFAVNQFTDVAFRITLGKVLWSLLLIFVASGIGKAMGLAMAKRKFRITFIALKGSLSLE